MFLRLCSIGGSPCVWANEEVAVLSITMRLNNSAYIRHVTVQVNRFAVIGRRLRRSVVQKQSYRTSRCCVTFFSVLSQLREAARMILPSYCLSTGILPSTFPHTLIIGRPHSLALPSSCVD